MASFARGLAEGLPIGLNIAQRREDSELRRQQQEALERHRAFARDLQTKQLALQQRQADLVVIDRLRQVLTDPNLHAEAKSIMLDDLAKSLNYDPKGERFKDLKKALIKMPKDQAAALSRSMVMAFPNLQPGEVTQFVGGLIDGGISIADVPKLIEQMAQRQTAAEGFSPGGFPAQPQAAPPADFSQMSLGDIFAQPTDVPGTSLSSPSPQLAGQLQAMQEQLGEPVQTLGQVFGPVAETSAPNVEQLGELDPAEWRRRAARFFSQGMTEEGNAALRFAQQTQPRQVNTLERIREKLAGGQELTPGEQRVYDDALRADPLARFLSALGGNQSQRNVAPQQQGSQTEPRFNSQAEVEAAVAKGIVKLGDTVIVKGQRMKVSR
jgi:hypothetical protein